MNKSVTNLKPESEVITDPLALLRAPFPANQISKLPKGNVMLDYVGHAATTDRLLDADPHWNWEPMAMTPEGLPAVDREGGLWIKLTVCGLTRLGYGTAPGKKGGDAMKELIGDAIRNAAMRFGVALDLWHKGDLHAEPEGDPLPSAEETAINMLRAVSVDKIQFKSVWELNKAGWKGVLEAAAYARVVKVMQEIAAKFPKDEPAPPQPPVAEDFGLGADEIPF